MPQKEEEMRKWVVVLAMAVAMAMVMECGEAQQLREQFYGTRCPNVEEIVKEAVSLKFQQTFVTAPSTLRLFFHDCFVQGCDASVLISSPNGDAEKDAPDNLSLAGDGFDTLSKAKLAVETHCPGVVSCADILALAARDVVLLVGGPRFEVELGRLDGRVSKASEVAGKLPGPDMNLEELTDIFGKNNLSQADMIALSGAHTIGFSHCSRFSRRIYNFTALMPLDPSLDAAYAQQLKAACPPDVDPTIAIDMDPTTPRVFDNVYYQNLVARKGLFSSDQILFTHPASQPTVFTFSNNPDAFNAAFASAMRKLGRVGVKSVPLGEIRTDCSSFNS
ncbi:PREDICTED: peroxidase 55 [Tarenaya hassleriana]|uniref:peroxidase 55 n=1 Tax=Tarenaya hassleriana TaxID=28532 RepID=UPI00053C5B5B|nr:PREDICTED: peroxidase 55 [Tarenaya hassleriana]